MLVRDTLLSQIPWIVMVSTPNAPDGLFERIEREPEETCLYKRYVSRLYVWTRQNIYEAEIEQPKRLLLLKENTTSSTWVRLAMSFIL